MIVVLKNGVKEEKRAQLIEWLKDQGLGIHISQGEYQTVLGLIGDTTHVDMDLIASLEIVDSVKRVTEPFKCCNRKFHPEDTVVASGTADSIGNTITAPEIWMIYSGISSEICFVAVGSGMDFPAGRKDLLTALEVRLETVLADGRSMTMTKAKMCTQM